MKQLSKLAAALSLAAGGLMFSSSASALAICTGCNWANGFLGGGGIAGNVYLGSHNPNTGDTSSFTHTNIADGALIPASFADTWWFDINPAGATSINASFIPSSSISNFKVTLYGPGTATCGAINAACTGPYVSGPLLATGITNPVQFTEIGFLTLASGRYSFVIEGLVSPGQADKSYSGQLTTARVPEPGSLALVAGALVAAGMIGRRRKA